jgi:hypothetical protein
LTPPAYASNAARVIADITATSDRTGPGDLGPPPARPPPVVVELEQPVLRARVSHSGQRVGRSLSQHMRHPVTVARDLEVHKTDYLERTLPPPLP